MTRFVFFIFLLYSFLSIAQEQVYLKGIECFKQEKYLFGNPKFLKDNAKSSSQKNTKRSYLEGMHFDELPGTKKEVEQIETVLLDKKWFVKSYLGELAEENSVKNIKNPYLLHFSTHGYFIDDSSFSTT